MDEYKDPDKIIQILVNDYDPIAVSKLNDQEIIISEGKEKNTLVVRSNGTNIPVRIISRDYQNGTYVLRINGKNFTCKTETNLSLLIKELGFNQQTKNKDKDLYAPMPGLVINTKVNIGDQVKEGQILLTLEAMKMENVLKAPRDGTIAGLYTSPGDKVEKNQLLVSLE
jgi:biotin carboxyl carrier protein